MRNICASLCVLLCTSNIFAAIKTGVVEYKQGDTLLKGYVAWDDSTNAKRPGVIVVHEWWGNDNYAHKRAEQLAGLGYVGFAVDMFGDGKTTSDPKVAAEWAGQIKSDPKLALARAEAGLTALKAQPMVDGEKIAAIGYCFGGSCALYMARANFPILGVVSFHGDLNPPPNSSPASVKPKVLVCTGAEDTFVPPPQILAFADEMRKAGADWQLIEYSGAQHSFTNPDADKHNIPGIAYNKSADERSWRAMKDFFAELFKK